jgi:hypothetical protein
MVAKIAKCGEHSEVCGFDDQFGEHSEVCGFNDQFGEHSEVCGFTNQFGEHLPSFSLGHISVFLQLWNALHTRCSLILEVLRLRTADWWRIANRYLYASAVVLTDRSEIPQRKLMSGCFYSLCRLSQHRHILGAAKHRATTCLP